jgi:hypothetical protein
LVLQVVKEIKSIKNKPRKLKPKNYISSFALDLVFQKEKSSKKLVGIFKDKKKAKNGK